MKFRPQRGSLAESMAEVADIEDFQALLDHLWETLDFSIDLSGVDPSSVKVEPYCYDDRTGWRTYLVTVDGQAVGFTDGPCTEPE